MVHDSKFLQLNSKLPLNNPKNLHRLMKPDPLALKSALRKREIELQKLMQQMKQDKLHSSTVFKNLQSELDVVKTQLASTDTVKK